MPARKLILSAYCLCSPACLLVDGGLPTEGASPTNITMTAPMSASSGSTTSEGQTGEPTTMVSGTTGSMGETSGGDPSDPSGSMTTSGATTTATITTGGQTSATSATTETTTTGSTTSTTTGMQKDPQPDSGLYSDCAQGVCDNTTDGCFELQDANMMKIDGYCALLCTTAADCLPKPNAPASTVCQDVGNGQKLCMLECVEQNDCPIGMTCESIDLNGATKTFCW